MKVPSVFSRDRDHDSMMAPMIDVVFLLLVFFVWTSSFQAIEYILPTGLSSQLSAGSSVQVEPTPEEDFEQLVIRMVLSGSEDGAGYQLTLNDVPMASLEELSEKLRTVVAINDTAPVIVHPDSAVDMGSVIATYDIAVAAGFEKVSFAINRLPE